MKPRYGRIGCRPEPMPSLKTKFFSQVAAAVLVLTGPMKWSSSASRLCAFSTFLTETYPRERRAVPAGIGAVTVFMAGRLWHQV
jgi:hypothetical protein